MFRLGKFFIICLLLNIHISWVLINSLKVTTSNTLRHLLTNRYCFYSYMPWLTLIFFSSLLLLLIFSTYAKMVEYILGCSFLGKIDICLGSKWKKKQQKNDAFFSNTCSPQSSIRKYWVGYQEKHTHISKYKQKINRNIF